MWRHLPDDMRLRINEATEEFANAVLGFDPASASKAQTSMMQAELAKFAGRLVEAESEVLRSHRECKALKAGYDRYLDAARRLERSVRADQNGADTREREVSLSRLIEHLERMKPELARGQKEGWQTQIRVGDLRETFEALSSKLRWAEANIGVGPSSQTTQPAVSKLAHSVQVTTTSTVSDLTAALSSISVALDAMNRETQRMRAENEALTSRTKAFEGDRLEHDPHIAAALDVVWHSPSSNGRSLRDRLNSLEDRTAPPSASASVPCEATV